MKPRRRPRRTSIGKKKQEGIDVATHRVVWESFTLEMDDASGGSVKYFQPFLVDNPNHAEVVDQAPARARTEWDDCDVKVTHGKAVKKRFNFDM